MPVGDPAAAAAAAAAFRRSRPRRVWPLPQHLRCHLPDHNHETLLLSSSVTVELASPPRPHSPALLSPGTGEGGAPVIRGAVEGAI